MTKEIRSPNVEGRSGVRSPDSSFGFRYSFGFRHSSFGFEKCRSWGLRGFPVEPSPQNSSHGPKRGEGTPDILDLACQDRDALSTEKSPHAHRRNTDWPPR